MNITKLKFSKWWLAVLWKFTDKEISEIKISSVPNNTKNFVEVNIIMVNVTICPIPYHTVTDSIVYFRLLYRVLQSGCIYGSWAGPLSETAR